MAVVELEDKDVLAAFLRRNVRAHVYELGDLDEFDWPYTRWFGWERAGRLEQVVLLYSEPAVPVLIAIAEEPLAAMDELLARPSRPTLPPCSTSTGRRRFSQCSPSGMRSREPSLT